MWCLRFVLMLLFFKSKLVCGALSYYASLELARYRRFDPIH